MDDEQVLDHIEKLVAQEQELWRETDEDTEPDLSDEERERLEKIRVELDRYWDALRQRRALRAAGDDPDDASLRDPETVEDYEQ